MTWPLLSKTAVLTSLLTLLALAGCSTESAKRPDTASGSRSDGASPSIAADQSATSQAKAAAEKKPFKFGDMLEPFSPPALDELEKQVKWIDRPVVDALELRRELDAKQKPLVSIEEALKLRNDSQENNEKILSALGRLPADDQAVNWDAELNRHTPGDVNSTNVLLTSSVPESEVNALTAFGLFSFDWEFNPFASADSVVKWQTSEDGMYDKVVMRDDLVWSDGQPITAHDVVFSFKTILTSAVPIPALRTGPDMIKWVEAYDDHTLVYFHKEPLATNVWNLNFYVIPRHIYEKHLADDPTLVNHPYHVALENEPVVGGPYAIKSRTRGQEMVLERRENYYMHKGKQVRDKPHFKTIRFRIRPELSAALLALKAGDIDEMNLTPEQWQNQTTDAGYYATNTKVSGLQWLDFQFMWNCQEPMFRDKRVRTAMSHAMDYKELLERLRYGLDKPCNGIFHPTARWAPKPAPPYFKQDLDKAEELLEEAGWTDSDGDGVRDKVVDGKKIRFEFTLLTMQRQDRIDVCTLMKECLDQLQIKCNVKPLEFAAMIEKLNTHDFQAAYGGWNTGTDPSTLANIFKTGKERNYNQYSNPEVDKLFEQGERELDLEKRTAIYQRLATVLYEDQPYTWLFYQSSFYGFNRDLRGYMFSPRGPYSYSPGIFAIHRAVTP